MPASSGPADRHRAWLRLRARARRGGDAPLKYCRSVAAKLQADSDLAAAARAAFGQPEATDDEACLYPLQLLRYADVDVLVSQTGEPGAATAAKRTQRHRAEARAGRL